MPRLILASASPRRQSLLREAGYQFEVDPANIPEDSCSPSIRPSELARYLALAKAEAVADRHRDDVVLAADTVVAFGETVLGKPADAADARRILQLLSGTTHMVITGVAVIHVTAQLAQSHCVFSAVRMRMLTDQEIDGYIAGGQWEGKAGAYGIQDPDPFVVRISGSTSNIVGLPMKETAALLAAAGIIPAGRKSEIQDLKSGT